VGSGQHRLCLEHTFDKHDDIEVINTIELRNVINPWTYQHLEGVGTHRFLLAVSGERTCAEF